MDRTSKRCDQIIELIDACLAEYERTAARRPYRREDAR
jgi:hypothetical protein